MDNRIAMAGGTVREVRFETSNSTPYTVKSGPGQLGGSSGYSDRM